jgi:hypothetical protein
MTAPAWARELVTAICADAGVAEPRLFWRRRAAAHSTGVARRDDGVIAVSAGTDEVDQRLTLLHELAHWISPRARARRGRSVHHGRAFYTVAFDLYRRHGISEGDALRLESVRYWSALRHAAAIGVEGAAEALAEHGASLRERPRRRWRVLVPEHRISLERQGRWMVCTVCQQRIVGINLARVRRARRPVQHVLLAASRPVI